MLFFDGRKADQKKLHTMYMKIARNCHEKYPFKITNTKVLTPLKWLNMDLLIKARVLNFMHSILINKKPESIYNNIIIPKRASKDIRYQCNSKIKNIFTGFIKLYNQLPGEFRDWNRKGFKFKLKKQITKLNLN